MINLLNTLMDRMTDDKERWSYDLSHISHVQIHRQGNNGENNSVLIDRIVFQNGKPIETLEEIVRYMAR